MTYEVWMEGYCATGQSATHEFIGKEEANNFKKACKIAMRKWASKEDYETYYDEDNMTFWGCRLFDNESDAARGFG